VDKSNEAGSSITSVKYNHDKRLGVAIDLNAIETELDTNTESHEEKAKIPNVYAIMLSDQGPANIENNDLERLII
jgi:hypothetical protein